MRKINFPAEKHDQSPFPFAWKSSAQESRSSSEKVKLFTKLFRFYFFTPKQKKFNSWVAKNRLSLFFPSKPKTTLIVFMSWLFPSLYRYSELLNEIRSNSIKSALLATFWVPKLFFERISVNSTSAEGIKSHFVSGQHRKSSSRLKGWRRKGGSFHRLPALFYTYPVIWGLVDMNTRNKKLPCWHFDVQTQGHQTYTRGNMEMVWKHASLSGRALMMQQEEETRQKRERAWNSAATNEAEVIRF